MLRHMVLFNLKPDVAASERDALFDQVRKLSDIGSVRSLAITRLLEPADPEYRGHMSSDFGYALLIEFDDEAGLYAYQKEPDHVTVGQEIRKHVSAIKVMDFVATDS
jgi:hypothetical protein